MKKVFKSKWVWAIIAVIAVAAILQWGGKTVVIRNAAIKDICEVHVSYVNDIAKWGPDRLIGRIVYPNSYDLHLPMYLDWFKPATQTTLNLWAVDCDGNVINSIQFDGKQGSFFTWQVSRIIPGSIP